MKTWNRLLNSSKIKKESHLNLRKMCVTIATATTYHGWYVIDWRSISTSK